MRLAKVFTVEELLGAILEETVEKLTQEDLDLLLKNQSDVEGVLIPIAHHQIELLREDPFLVDGNKLYWALAILSYLKTAKAFDLLLSLSSIEMPILEECVGNAFVRDCLPWMLAATCEKGWNELTFYIEDMDLDIAIRASFIQAIGILVAKGEAAREEVVGYLKEWYQRFLFEGFDDIPLATEFVRLSREIWPGECLEEIRELFGIGLVNQESSQIEGVIRAYHEGRDICLKHFHDKISTYHPLLTLVRGILPNSLFLREETQALSLDQEDSVFETVLNEGGASFDLSSASGFSLLPLPEQEKMVELEELFSIAPDEALQQARERIGRFSQFPVVYEHLYTIYWALGWHREAISLLKQMVERFPTESFVLIEYARYLIRRGERDKAFCIFSSS